MNGVNDEVILAARLFLATLFLIFGWRKLRDFRDGTSDGAGWRSDGGYPLTGRSIGSGSWRKTALWGARWLMMSR